MPERLFSCSMPPQGTDWNYDKKTFRAPESFFSRGLNAPLIFYFFTRCTCFESNFCPPRFLNLINSPRLNCKDSPRTSSALALNYADIFTIHGSYGLWLVSFYRDWMGLPSECYVKLRAGLAKTVAWRSRLGPTDSKRCGLEPQHVLVRSFPLAFYNMEPRSDKPLSNWGVSCHLANLSPSKFGVTPCQFAAPGPQ